VVVVKTGVVKEGPSVRWLVAVRLLYQRQVLPPWPTVAVMVVDVPVHISLFETVGGLMLQNSSAVVATGLVPAVASMPETVLNTKNSRHIKCLEKCCVGIFFMRWLRLKERVFFDTLSATSSIPQ
jgi:hypothetical protein